MQNAGNMKEDLLFEYWVICLASFRVQLLEIVKYVITFSGDLYHFHLTKVFFAVFQVSNELIFKVVLFKTEYH
jgi:hypothetical protein